MKKPLLVIVWLAVLCLRLIGQESAPLLVPPTLVPTPVRGVVDAVPAESAVARIVRDQKLRVGTLYNEPPFGELTVRGEVRGFDAALARKLAEAWGVELELMQVTRQNGIDALQNGSIDLLIAAEVHDRALDQLAEFSDPYRVSKQAMMVRNDDPAETPLNLSGRSVGYVVGTASERALQTWIAQSGALVNAVAFPTLDRAIGALFASEVDGVVARNEQLLRVAGDQIFSAKVLDEAVEIEPFAIAFTRQDISLRNLVNRTLQVFVQNKTLEGLYGAYFQGQAIDADVLPIYANLGENPPSPADFSTEIRYPQQYVVPTMLQNRVVRVAGLFPVAEDAPEGQRRVYEFNRQLVELMAARWGMTVQIVEGGDVYELLELGLADMAVGVPLDWAYAERVDFSQPVLFHGDRLMVETRSQVTGFLDLRGRWIGVMDTDTGAQDRAQVWADSVLVVNRWYSTFEQDAAKALLQDNNADAIYGDSLKLLEPLTANPDDLRLTDRWYSRAYMGIAVPRNDIDARLLVNYTLQEMVKDGTLANLLALVIPLESEMPKFLVQPGANTLYGLKLGS